MEVNDAAMFCEKVSSYDDIVTEVFDGIHVCMGDRSRLQF